MPFGHREDRLTASCYPSPVRRAKKRISGQRGTAMADTHRRIRIQRMSGLPSPLFLGIASFSLSSFGCFCCFALPSPSPSPPPSLFFFSLFCSSFSFPLLFSLFF